jgi:cell division protein FtsL
MILYVVGAVIAAISLFFYGKKLSAPEVENLLKKIDEQIEQKVKANEELQRQVESIPDQAPKSDSDIANDLNKL